MSDLAILGIVYVVTCIVWGLITAWLQDGWKDAIKGWRASNEAFHRMGQPYAHEVDWWRSQYGNPPAELLKAWKDDAEMDIAKFQAEFKAWDALPWYRKIRGVKWKCV